MGEEITTAVEEIRESVDGLREVTLTEDRVSELIAEAAASGGGYRPPDSPDARVVSEPEEYGPRGRRSWFADLVKAKMSADSAAAERLARQSEISTRDLTSTDGAGGEFVPPTYMQADFLELARAGRPFANAVMGANLPPNTDSLNIPKLSTGTATAAQSDGGAVQETDAQTGNVSVPVRTVAGQQDVSRQLFDRSIPGVDQVLLADLASDYATKLDVQTLTGDGNAPNAKGVTAASGTSAVTYTSASPTVQGVYSKIADALQRVHTLRFLPPTLIAMHPRRWGWFTASVDGSQRPLITPVAPQNAMARFDRVASENFVGEIQGLPVLVDASIPTNTGASTNIDPIIVTRASDLWLFEEGDGSPHQNTYFEVLSGNLGVRLQVYGYFAFTAERYGPSTSIISGTGLAAPTF